MKIHFIGKENSTFSLGFSLSLLIHLSFFAAIILYKGFNYTKPVVNSIYLQINNHVPENNKQVKSLNNNVKEVKAENNIKSKSSNIDPVNIFQFYNIKDINADTSMLKQIYSESTLNVQLKYPNGWTYIDQNKNNQLDGVTFWFSQSNFNPPPYVHLEVKEKYLFNKSRFKFNKDFGTFVAYYNEPKEIEEQVSQVFYIRTKSDEDFSLKLIMKGRDAFKSFQPDFFAMIKSFKFGNSIFN